MIALLVVTDGRTDYLRETVSSAAANLDPTLIGERWMFDDTGDVEHRAMLLAEFPQFHHINGGERQGFGGAIRSAWAHLVEFSDAEQIFHLEQDFTFNTAVQLAAMSLTVDEHPHLAQIALRRQPWNPAEEAAGGVVELHPEAFTECSSPHGTWLEHRLFYTTNPCLYSRSLMYDGWPEGDRSEGMFSAALFVDPAVRCAYWGSRSSGEAVTHIGHQRVGVGY